MSTRNDVTSGAEVLVPEAVDDPEHGEAGSDDDEALVLKARPLRRHVLVLAPFEHRFVDRVQAERKFVKKF